jgi:hypothetical protein
MSRVQFFGLIGLILVVVSVLGLLAAMIIVAEHVNLI